MEENVEYQDNGTSSRVFNVLLHACAHHILHLVSFHWGGKGIDHLFVNALSQLCRYLLFLVHKLPHVVFATLPVSCFLNLFFLLIFVGFC